MGVLLDEFELEVGAVPTPGGGGGGAETDPVFRAALPGLVTKTSASPQVINSVLQFSQAGGLEAYNAQTSVIDNLASVGNYSDGAGGYNSQVELGSSGAHTNINSADRPTVELPGGAKESVAYVSDFAHTATPVTAEEIDDGQDWSITKQNNWAFGNNLFIDVTFFVNQGGLSDDTIALISMPNFDVPPQTAVMYDLGSGKSLIAQFQKSGDNLRINSGMDYGLSSSINSGEEYQLQTRIGLIPVSA